KSDPENGCLRGVRVSYAENSQAERCSTDKNGSPDACGVPATLNERVDEPTADDEFCDGRAEPRNGGVEERALQVQMLSFGEIRRQPGKKQIKNIVVGAVAEREANDFALLQEIGKRSASCGADGIFRLRATEADVVALGLGEFRVVAGVAEKSEEK